MKNKMLIICIVVAIIVIGLVMIIVKDKNKDIQINIEDLAIYNIEIEKLNSAINKLTYKQKKEYIYTIFLI